MGDEDNTNSESVGAETAPHRDAGISWQEWLVVLVLVVTADLWLYRGYGYAGIAAFLLIAALLFWLLRERMPRIGHGLVVGLLLLGAIGKLVFDGSEALTLIAFVVLASWCVILRGRDPDLLDTAVICLTSVPMGIATIIRARRPASSSANVGSWTLSILFPSLAILVFASLFVMANPEIRLWVSDQAELGWAWMVGWSRQFEFMEIVFWLVVATVTLGMLRPLLESHILREPQASVPNRSHDHWYVAYRNTLVAVSILFGAYLVFEFMTLFRRDFPDGFYYAGYAHEGAAWLTVALALATGILSLIFRRGLRQHPQTDRLRRWGWLWSLENILLAVAVYNPMLVYIDFNGMTRMRTVGLFGITAVVIGFLLVLTKIARGHSFVWLIRRQMWTVAVAATLFAILPVDMLVHSYNAWRVVTGDPAPSVQVIAHPVSRSGYLVVPAYLDSDDPVVRQGVLAMLADEQVEVESALRDQRQRGWTAFQLSDSWLAEHLSDLQKKWTIYRDDPDLRAKTIAGFRDYAWQWY